MPYELHTFSLRPGTTNITSRVARYDILEQCLTSAFDMLTVMVHGVSRLLSNNNKNRRRFARRTCHKHLSFRW